ncbi:hypothetical protein [Embleya sp. NPDC005575]|uniref:hypothetical protein n=1 Tax=Embleya sp. NPDC005575 TaxID=3156892 RepID=UPI0033BA20F6
MDRLGRYAFTTVRPGAPSGDAEPVPGHVGVRARPAAPGGPARVLPQDDRHADPLFALVPPTRHETLIAVWEESGSYRFDVYIQGEQETVFLAV